MILTPLEQTQQALDISVTERATFKICRRRWELQVLENLTPAVPPSLDLEFGTGMHRALEQYYISKANLAAHTGDLTWNPLDAGIATWNNWYMETLTRLEDNSMVADELLDEFVALGDLGEEMLQGYHQYAKIEDRFTVHAVEGLQTGAGQSWLNKHLAEREFISNGSANGIKLYPLRQSFPSTGRLLVPIINPHLKKPVKRGAVLSARIDLLVHRIDEGMKGLWIYDHKTATGQPNDRGLDFDDQVTAYCYAVWRWLGIMPRGVCFNYLLKRVPKPPRILKKGTLSTDKSQLTTAAQYRKALRQMGLMLKDGTVSSPEHAATYESFLSRGWSPFFTRHYVTRNFAEIQSFENRLFEEYMDMWKATKDELPLYPNMSKQWCPNCQVAPICHAIEDGSDWEDVIEHRYMLAPDRKATL